MIPIAVLDNFADYAVRKELLHRVRQVVRDIRTLADMPNGLGAPVLFVVRAGLVE
jgi:hypothetical protein